MEYNASQPLSNSSKKQIKKLHIKNLKILEFDISY